MLKSFEKHDTRLDQYQSDLALLVVLLVLFLPVSSHTLSKRSTLFYERLSCSSLTGVSCHLATFCRIRIAFFFFLFTFDQNDKS